MAENNHPSYRLSVPSLAVQGKPAVSLCTLDGLHCRATCKTVDDFQIDLASFAKDACEHLGSTKTGTPTTNKDLISISEVLNETSSAGKRIALSERMITAISCRRFFVQERALPNAGSVVVAKLVKDDELHRLPENIEDRHVSRTTTARIYPVSSHRGSEGFFSRL